MASTRMKYETATYNQDLKASVSPFLYESMKYKCISQNTAFPSLGMNMPMMVNGYNNKILSKNASDIESSLFGITSPDHIVNPKKAISAQINEIKYVSFFKTPRVQLPKVFIIDKNQRPKGPFC